VIETRNLRKTYLGRIAVPVLHGVDLQIRAGEFVAIVGQSGSGKTTLLNLLGALDSPTGGTVVVNGVDLGTLDEDGLADLPSDEIGFVFQFHYLLDEFTCLENALMPIMIRRGSVTRAERDRGGRPAASSWPRGAASPDAGHDVRRPEPTVRHRAGAGECAAAGTLG